MGTPVWLLWTPSTPMSTYESESLGLRPRWKIPGERRDKTGQARTAKLDWPSGPTDANSLFHQIDDDVTCDLSASATIISSSKGPSSFQTSSRLKKHPINPNYSPNPSSCSPRIPHSTLSSRSPGTLDQERRQQRSRPNLDSLFSPQGHKAKGTRHQISPIDDS